MLLKNIGKIRIGIYAPCDHQSIDLDKIYTINAIKELPIISVVDSNMRSIIRFDGEEFDDFQNILVKVYNFHTAFAEGMSRGCPFVSSDYIVKEDLSQKKCFRLKSFPSIEPIFIDVIFSKIENETFLEIARSIHAYGKKNSCLHGE
ncbi:hypothetical protein [Acetobacter cibinongensis]|uniref:Uncharacterized protein n=1 Tax=Acetobacter cibinongensis TaxID=146475 RepID=A0A1Z5YUH6_9PROT|nr:hypothetical protein [Acetobacter cibinongensis]OUJ02203.1 hypothetical protein HK14_06570 [Acetobacter cibinongensis]